MPDENHFYHLLNTCYMADVLKMYSFIHHILSNVYCVPDTVLGNLHSSGRAESHPAR